MPEFVGKTTNLSPILAAKLPRVRVGRGPTGSVWRAFANAAVALEFSGPGIIIGDNPFAMADRGGMAAGRAKVALPALDVWS